MDLKMYSMLIAILLFVFQMVETVYIPPIPCPDIFEYLKYGSNYIGMVTVKDQPLQTLKVEVEFTQREPITTNYNGRLSFVDELPTVQEKMQNGQPIKYRVDFPISNVVPKLKGISVNDYRICSGAGMNAPSTSFKLSRTFYPSASAQPTFVTRPRVQTTTPDFEEFSPDLKFSPDFTKNPFFRNIFEETPTQVQSIPQPEPQPKLKTRFQQPRPTMPATPPTPAPTPTQAPSIDLECGREPLTPLVAFGNDLPRGKFPWLVAIFVRDGININFQCGGSLISSRTVISAAHCFPSIPADRIFVGLGRHNLFITEDGAVQRDISRISFHPQYNESIIPDADIILLHMTAPVTQFIRPICLWSQSSDINLINGKKAFVAGWGSDNEGNPVSKLPKMVEAKITNETECLRAGELFRVLTTSRSLCAGNRDGSGPCLGDSGGGLMINVFGIWTLRGVVSLGETSQRVCNLNTFVIYCDVGKHISWIKLNMLR